MKSENTERFTALFNESDLHGTCEAFVFDAIDNLSPFLSALIGDMCALYYTAKVTESFPECVDLENSLFTRHFSVNRTEETLLHLRSRMEYVKKRKM